MSDLIGFEKELDKFADSLGIKIETVIKKITLQTFTGIVLKTPVDTGRARASWVIGIERSVNSPALSDNQEFSEAQATAYANRELAELDQIKSDSTVFISNSLQYIQDLENGKSRQAPAGMVAVTLAEIERDIKRLTDEL